MFVRKLVDDLNRDNEVLVDNNTDLKTAFTFLVREHKKLQFELDKQKRNNALLESYRQQFIELKKERDDAFKTVTKLREKLEIMNDVMQLAAQEQQVFQTDTDEAFE